tara:strand:- start:13 stop:480 length:468 start_codon:yes stop_codon:yes gene_type:complete
MKIKNLLVLLILSSSFFVFGQQNQDRKEKKEQIESARIDYISSAIGLTEEQAIDFWPVYNEYWVEHKEIKREGRKLLKDQDLGNISEQQAKNLLQTIKGLQEKEKVLNDTYEPKILEIISYKQLLQLMKAEREFIRMQHKKGSKEDNHQDNRKID